MEIEGTAAEIMEVIAMRSMPSRSAAKNIALRAGTPTEISSGDGNKHYCRSIEEARRWLNERGLPVSNACIGAHLNAEGEYHIGKFTVRKSGGKDIPATNE